jgi:NAD+ diphosphatase
VIDGRACFFQGDSLLLPRDFPDSNIAAGLPVNLSHEFKNYDLFRIPSIKDSSSVINVLSVPRETVLPDYWRTFPVRQALALFSAENNNQTQELDDILRACHIAQWRRDSVFCGTCGAENGDANDGIHRLCPRCGRIEFPRICPAVIIIITDNENRILLAHNKNFKAGVYSHISGYSEAGETLESAVLREIREEVNIEVTDIEYVKSQPWPFPNTLMVGFKARYLSGTVKADGVEIEDAKWFSRDNMPPKLPGEGSLSRHFIDRWMEGAL